MSDMRVFGNIDLTPFKRIEDKCGRIVQSRKSLFTREEKIAAVSLVIDKGRSTLSVANEYGVHDNTIIKWCKQYLTTFA